MKSKLPTVLRSLDAAIKRSYPRRHTALGKPASKKSVDALAKGFGQPLPDDVRALYAWRASAAGLLVSPNAKDPEDAWDLDEPAVVLDDHRTWCAAKRPAKSWRATWLPLFGNGAGDNVCLDVESGELIEVLHEDDASRPLVAQTLEEAMAHVLSLAKAGRWRGSPESKRAATLSSAFEKYDPNKGKIRFDSLLDGSELHRLLASDPAGGLAVLAAAESRLNALTGLGRDFEATYRRQILFKRTLAHIALEDAEAARDSYLSTLTLARKSGWIDDSLSRLEEGFEKLNQRRLADDVKEVIALKETKFRWESQYGDECDFSVLECWLTAEARPSDTDGSTYRSDGMKELVEQMESGLGATQGGAARARHLAVKAAALRELGKKTASEKAWKEAAAADAKVAELWRGHALLSCPIPC